MSQFTGLLSATGLGSIRNLGVVAAEDVTPNAVNWADDNTGNEATTTMQQITGISQDITLTVSWTGQETGGAFYYNINSTNTYNIGSHISLTSSPTSITISNNQYLGFRLYYTAGGTKTRAVTVTNSSDGGAAIDTFTLTTFYDI